MKKLNKLLRQISEIVLREKTQQEEKRKRGENFNIFRVLGLSTSEVRLHSAFLAELLNPNGDHGLGDHFLKSFINNVIRKRCDFTFDYNSAKVYVEYFIGNVSSDYKEGGRIDLLIRDQKGHAIIVENKIYAGDQPWQMYRYNMYARKSEGLSCEQYVLLYLTLHGSEPSEESTGKEDFNYLCISYKDDILSWLDCCIGIAALFPRIRETISQYKSTLNNILEIMSETTETSMVELLTSEDNIEATLGILSVNDKIKTTIRRKFIDKLISKLQPLIDEHDLEINLSNIDRFVSLSSGWPNIQFKKKTSPMGSFSIEVESRQVYYGVSVDETKFNPQKLIMEKQLWIGKPNGKWPYGWDFFDGDLRYWDGKEALLDMCKGHNIIDTVYTELKKVIDNNCFEELEKMLS